MNHMLNELIIVRVHLSLYSMGSPLASEVAAYNRILCRQRHEQLQYLVADINTFDSFAIT